MNAQYEHSGVLIHDGKKYAVGMTWFVASDEDDTNAAKSRASKAKGDFYCLRSSIVNQHGVGYLAKGHRAGMAAGAALAVDKLVGEWHGVFEAENGWWYLQVHSDTIAPRGDQFFKTEEEAYSAFMAHKDDHNWPHSYAPKKWNLETREVSLDTLLEGAGGAASLQAISLTALLGSKRNLNIAVACIVVAAIITTLIMIMPENFTTPVPKTNKKIAETAKSKQIAQLPNEVKPLPELNAPDEAEIVELPKPSQLIDACGQAAALIMRPIPGWPIKTMLCSNQKAQVQWGQTVGSMNMARSHIASFPSEAIISITGRDLNASMPLARLPLIQQTEWLTREESIFRLEQRLNNLGSLQLKPVTPPAPPVKNKNRKPPPPPRPYVEINLKTKVSPKKLAGYFDVPGMEVTSIRWDVQSGSWEYVARLTTERKGS